MNPNYVRKFMATQINVIKFFLRKVEGIHIFELEKIQKKK